MKIIIYGSQYGTTKQYAKELSKKTNIKAYSYENIKNIDKYETIIYRSFICWRSFRNG